MQPKYLYEIIKKLGLTSNLNVCLDVADPRSYDGSSQTWTDLTGNSNNYFRGPDVSATAKDPTFNGTANRWLDTTYFSFDGGDLFKETTDQSFADNWHKNNGACTILAVYYPINKAATTSLWYTQCTGLLVRNTRVLRFAHNIDNSTLETNDSTATLTASTWNFIAAAFDEATTSLDLHINSTVEAKTPTASTSTIAPTDAYRFSGNDDTPTAPAENGERLACFAAWSTKISSTNVQLIYTALKSRRFTTLP